MQNCGASRKYTNRVYARRLRLLLSLGFWVCVCVRVCYVSYRVLWWRIRNIMCVYVLLFTFHLLLYVLYNVHPALGLNATMKKRGTKRGKNYLAAGTDGSTREANRRSRGRTHKHTHANRKTMQTEREEVHGRHARQPCENEEYR